MDIFQVDNPVATIAVAVLTWIIRGAVLHVAVEKILLANAVDAIAADARSCARWCVGLAFVMGWLF